MRADDPLAMKEAIDRNTREFRETDREPIPGDLRWSDDGDHKIEAWTGRDWRRA